MPQLRVSAGSSLSSLSVLAPNYDETGALDVSSDLFEGKIAVRIRDFAGEVGGGKERKTTTESDYFDVHTGLTWSMAIQGRFKKEVNADDVLYGNVFEKPIRDHLPYGTAAALKFVNFVDPSLEQDIYADKPWALSPLVATMNYLNASKEGAKSDKPAWNSKQPSEDVLALFESPSSAVEALKDNANARRSYFANKAHRQEVTLKPDSWLDMDFCNGYLDFNTFSLKLPGGLHFSLLKYWDGQPVTFVCRNRNGTQAYFYIVFEILDEALKAKVTKGTAGDDSKTKGQEEEPASTSEQAEDDLGVD